MATTPSTSVAWAAERPDLGAVVFGAVARLLALALGSDERGELLMPAEFGASHLAREDAPSPRTSAGRLMEAAAGSIAGGAEAVDGGFTFEEAGPEAAVEALIKSFLRMRSCLLQK